MQLRSDSWGRAVVCKTKRGACGYRRGQAPHKPVCVCVCVCVRETYVCWCPVSVCLSACAGVRLHFSPCAAAPGLSRLHEEVGGTTRFPVGSGQDWTRGSLPGWAWTGLDESHHLDPLWAARPSPHSSLQAGMRGVKSDRTCVS